MKVKKELAKICSKGHLWSETAVYFPSNPRERVCSACRREYYKKWAKEHPGRNTKYNKDWIKKNPEKHKESVHKHYIKNREKFLRKDREYYQRTKEYKKWEDVKRIYGITKEQFDLMFKDQNGLCAICSCDISKQWILNIDHCHKTGKVRGLLCNRCNVGLGSFKDSVDLLKIAMAYLEV
jgi:hypothetical protein